MQEGTFLTLGSSIDYETMSDIYNEFHRLLDDVKNHLQNSNYLNVSILISLSTDVI